MFFWGEVCSLNIVFAIFSQPNKRNAVGDTYELLIIGLVAANVFLCSNVSIHESAGRRSSNERYGFDVELNI